MDTLLEFTLFGATVWLVLVTLTILTLLFVSESYNQGFVATAVFIIYVGLLYKWGSTGHIDISGMLTWLNLLYYLIIGFLFALLRTYLYGVKEKRKYKKESNYAYNDNLKKFKDSLLTSLQGKVSRWWFMWPISALHYMFGTWLRDIWDWIWKHVSNMFKNLALKGFAE